MCGIFGATDRYIYKELYEDNQQRGSSSYGGAWIKKDGAGIVRSKQFITHPHNCDWYIGHTRAPTNANGFNKFHAHPFVAGGLISFHNGIIQNAAQLATSLGVSVDIDSEIIPIICSQGSGDEVDNICKGLQKLDGIYGLALYSTLTDSVYLARCACTLYASSLGVFSSQKPSKHTGKLLEEGILYTITDCSLEEVGTFQYNSPYLVL